MKKSLSAILSLAMAFSMFSSVALAAEGDNTATEAENADAAKTSANFSDLKDLDAATKAKFDAMISAGVFDGVKEGTFGLKEKMNRAQFAKVAALIFGLKVDSSLKTSSFTDVKADDPANGYALPYIEAVKAAGITDGYAPGQFNPAGEVTKEQLATFLIRGLNKDKEAQATPGVTDKTVSDWAKGYVALAIQLKLLSSGADGTFGGTSAATRDLLVTSAYEGQIQYKNANKPAKASVAEAKAAGVQTVQVKLDRDVDTKKATLTLKKGSANVETTVQWSDDKKTATLTLVDAKINAGEYSVTLGGLDAKDVDKTVAKFTAEDEQLKSIDFLNANDSIAYSTNVVVKIAAKNQYGERASYSAGSYSVYTTGANFIKLTKGEDGTLNMTLDTKNGGGTQGVTVIPVTIVNNDQHLTVSKSYKLGTAPILTKLELGEAQYSNDTAKAITAKGDTVNFDLNLFDQYGGNIAYDSTDFVKDNVNVIWNDYIGTNTSGGSVISQEIEDNGNNIPRLKLSLNENVDKTAEYTFTVTTQAATATAKVKIQSAKIATKIELGDFNDVIATGDQDVYIPVNAYDAQGNLLSLDDLTSDVNRDRIKLTVSGAGSYEQKITDSGANRGSIHLTNINAGSKSAVSVTAIIATANANSTATRTYTVADVRVPDKIKEVVAPAKEFVKGASSSFKYVVYDQYGKQMDYNKDTNGNGSVGTSVTYDVYVSLTTANGNNAFKIVGDDSTAEAGAALIASNGTKSYSNVDEWNPNAFKAFNDGLRLVAAANATQNDAATLRMAIRKTEAGKAPVDIAYTDKQIKIVADNADLNYSVAPLGTFWNFRDSGSQTNMPGSAVTPLGTVSLSADMYLADKTPFRKEVKLIVTNSSGDKVAVPNSVIKSVQTSDRIAAIPGQDLNKMYPVVSGQPANTVTNSTYGQWFVMPYKTTGSANVVVTYVNQKGETKSVTSPIVVKADRMQATTLIAGNKKVSVPVGSYYISDEYSALVATGGLSKGLMDLTMVDNYGVEVRGLKLMAYNQYLYGLSFVAQHIVLKGAASNNAADNEVSIDANGKVTIGSNVAKFDLSATAANGASATTEVNVQ